MAKQQWVLTNQEYQQLQTYKTFTEQTKLGIHILLNMLKDHEPNPDLLRQAFIKNTITRLKQTCRL